MNVPAFVSATGGMRLYCEALRRLSLTGKVFYKFSPFTIYKHLLPTVRRNVCLHFCGGWKGRVMICVCVHLATIDSIMNSFVSQSILESNVRPYVGQLQLC
ncbi:hypothetical protein ILYODFUR_017535 [Ilyodon furcidens]|uniref:Uncharacterized protein n=1 Tax=Ilyodon furcidens TaxID=33524 RepID=A0ABV0V659_9TELE